MYTQDFRGKVDSNETLSDFLLDELTEGTVIKRIADPLSASQTGKAVSWLAKLSRRGLGQSSIGWGFSVFRLGITELRRRDIDLVFGVTPPFTNALVAMLLASFGKKPLVLDLKDDWVGSPTFLKKNAVRQKIEKLVESLIVRTSAAVITVTPQSFKLYRERYLHLRQPEKFHLIPNGCDLDEYEPLAIRTREIRSDRFLILSAAWGFRKDYRDITPLLFALDMLLKRRPDAKEKMDVLLLGDSLSSEYNELIAQLDLAGIVQCVGTLKRSELVESLWNADLFLLIQPLHNTTAISGTLYEYWATGKAPVLLISEAGASSELVAGNRLGRHFHFDQVAEIADYVEQIFDAYESGQPVWIDRAGIKSFDRRTLAKRMHEIWSALIRAPQE